MKKMLFAIAAMMMFAACGGGENLPIENTKWNLAELQGATNEAFGDADTFWFSLDGESIIGVGACNRFFGGYQLTKCGSFKIGGMGMTRMACHNMDLEDAFVRSFEEIDGYEIEGDNLTLKSGDKVIARFKGESIEPGADVPANAETNGEAPAAPSMAE